MAETTFWSLVEDAARLRPDSVVLADDYGRALTTVALRDAAERAAAGLLDLGVAPGDTVSWQLPTTLEAAVLLAACTRLGVTQNPIIPLLREREVGFIVDQVGTKMLVVPETWRGFSHGDMARSLRPRPLVLDFDGRPGPGLRLPAGDPGALPPPPDDARACRWIYYSSGTTAAPKGARHTDASVIASSNGVVGHLGITEGDVHPLPWPFAHVGGVGMLAAALRGGGRHVLFDSFDPKTTPVRMAAHDPTILGSATPFFLAYLAAQRGHGGRPLFPQLRACTSGGAPVASTVISDVAAGLGVPGITNAWGLTEFPVACSESPDLPELGSTVGHPVDGVSVHVADDGELRLKGPQCFLGYTDPSLDADAFDAEGWFRTGDLGTIREDGRVVILGRIKDVIIRNAENISSLEVEEALHRHPAIAEVTVLGLPDPRTGERLCAVVVVEPGQEVTLGALAEHCMAEGLARYKCPEQVHFLAELPRNSMGKVLKNDIRAAIAAGRVAAHPNQVSPDPVGPDPVGPDPVGPNP
jgi:acyl-CoA synthetase (AMP-forming)/AMP-acid ligase II